LADQGFKAMPEVRRVFDFHLDANNDESLTIRSIYGHRAPWLQFLDPQWAKENRTAIFPGADSERWHSAWDTYIGYNAPYNDVFEWLKEEYREAIERIGTHDHPWAQSQGPDCFLAQHLITFYLKGMIRVDSEILTNFYQKADTNLRAFAFNFLGRTLRDTKGEVSSPVLDRAKRLWTLRKAEAQNESEHSVRELQEFGWWFTSSKLDVNWSLNQLLDVLRLAKTVQPDFLVVERLVETASAFPRESVQALQLMIAGDVKGWGILGWSDKAKDIIRAARKSADHQARQIAEDLVNKLGSRGHFDFGAILEEPLG
jgi:hypothetical protein